MQPDAALIAFLRQCAQTELTDKLGAHTQNLLRLRPMSKIVDKHPRRCLDPLNSDDSTTEAPNHVRLNFNTFRIRTRWRQEQLPIVSRDLSINERLKGEDPTPSVGWVHDLGQHEYVPHPHVVSSCRIIPHMPQPSLPLWSNSLAFSAQIFPHG